ncbi:hypothetical protein [Desulfobacula toluolica]|uniref:hypothetical protein n=1 Tax=Desulfobacula toluolica TaxID=28223 RepID=UPI0002F694FF|nr:hypothetical protein [Desulfobacula toluolica]
MCEKQHKELVEIAIQIGQIADMPQWATAGMTSCLPPGKTWKELTIGEFLSMRAKTVKHINNVSS